VLLILASFLLPIATFAQSPPCTPVGAVSMVNGSLKKCTASGFIPAGGVGQVVAGDSCTTLGEQAFLATGAPVYCNGSNWIAVGGGSAISGMIAYFNALACPSGWIKANGTAGTLDLRGEFIRSFDDGRGIDTGRILGSAQVDMLASHFHTYAAIVNAYSWLMAPSTGTAVISTQTLNTSATGGTETRPKNIALLACQAL
jgi:hypothetical protein